VWLTWWAGDTLGVMVGAPIALAWIGQPREAWAPRRLTVGLPLLATTVLVGIGIAQVAHWRLEREDAAFEHEAFNANAALSAKLTQPLSALQGLKGVYASSEDVTRDEFRHASEDWLQGDVALRALGWSERLRAEEIADFEARMRAEGLPRFRVKNRGAGDQLASPDRNGPDVVAITFIEPMLGNDSALGVNSLSVEAAREAIDHTVITGAPAASRGFVLSQDRDASGNGQRPGTGVVAYQAIYRGGDQGVEARRKSFAGVVFATMRMDRMLQSVNAALVAPLTLCLIDADAATGHQVLAGEPQCDLNTAQPMRRLAHDFAGRHWQLQVQRAVTDKPVQADASAWLMSVVSLLGASLLGALLLTVTGRARRIETAVRERTSELVAEVRERHQAETALRVSEQRFRNIFNHVPVALVYADLDGRVREANPRYCELSGYHAADLLGRRLDDLTHPEDTAQDVTLTARLIDGSLPLFTRNKRQVAKNGEIVWVQSTVTLLRDPEGRPLRIVAAVQDITEHLRLADAERARDAAEAANQAKSEFLSRMSHELRTPLNAMLGFAQLLEIDQRHPLDEAQRPWVGQIQSAGWHLLEMINDVLDLSRIESGNLRLQAHTLTLPDELQAALALVTQDAQKRGITISTDLANDALRVRGDATRVKQILINLLSNAVKYNTDHGLIRVISRSLGAVISVSVTDTGLGMTPEQLGALFQPFNRLGREHTALQGTGIGLVISQRLAELMGGTLSAHSVPDEGSTFVLTLPAVVVDTDTQPSELDMLTPSAAGYHRRRVLYVEDNETNIEVMRGILAQRPQVELEVAMTGRDGLSAIATSPPDVLLLDMNLPDMTGIELLKTLRSNPALRDLPVVVVSADALGGQVDAALQAGALRYLTKPVNVGELLRTVDALLHEAETRFG
jgi:PAS domain S-box-containing protein